MTPLNIDKPEQMNHGQTVVHGGSFATVYFGPGAVDRLDAVVTELGAKRPVIVCTPGRAKDGASIKAKLSMESVLMADAITHTPVEVSDRVAEEAVREGVDLVISIGGGSSNGLGKALTKRLGLRHIAVPTTYSGSELTPFLGEARAGDKLRVRDDKLRPVAIIYDPELGASLPAHISAASGMNAMAHAVGALTTSKDPDICWAAEKAVRCLVSALPKIVEDIANKEARAQALYGAWLAGYCIEAPMALHHKLCHVLGGVYSMPHAETHAAILPHSLAFNGVACPDVVERLGDVFGGDPATGLFDFIEKLGLDVRLRDLGLPEEGVLNVAKIACANPYANPRPFTEKDIAELLGRAWRGERPHVSPS